MSHHLRDLRLQCALVKLCCLLLTAAGALGGVAGRCLAGDLGHVPLFDGERSTRSMGSRLTRSTSTCGAGPSLPEAASPFPSSRPSSAAARGPIKSTWARFPTTARDSSNALQRPHLAFYRQDRDLTQYQMLEGYVRNDATADLNLSLILNDYRDNGAQRAVRTYKIPAGGGWTQIEAPLDLASDWTVTGSPDLKRTFALTFQVDADFGPASGSLYFDDFALQENGPSIDVATAPIETVVDRLAHRQFLAFGPLATSRPV